MKINCECGNIIVDNSDQLKDKGHLISDTQWFNFWDAIDDAVENTPSSKKGKEAAVMRLRQNDPSKLVWECQQCGKLYFNSKNGDLISFSPDNGSYNSVLDQNNINT